MSSLSADDPRVGTVLAERYRIDALVGEGGMGKVYSAEHVMMKKRLAVKVLHRELTTVPDVVARFEREAMAAANIDHPNVAAATDFGKLPDGAVFLVLEFVQGKNLRDEMADGPIAIERALHITRQIAAGLGSAHIQGIVHRDLKPENVMLVAKANDRDFVKVLDFGIAKVPIGEVPNTAKKPDQPITRAGMVFGTPEYMAPEQALGQTVDGRADLYALGVILFEMLAGVRPFSSQSPVGILGQQLANPPPSFAERAPSIVVPPAVEQIVHRLLARDREHRYAAAAEVVSRIDALLAPAPGRGGYRFTVVDGSPMPPLITQAIRPPALSDAQSSNAGRGSRAGISALEGSPAELPVPKAPLLPSEAGAGSRTTLLLRLRKLMGTVTGRELGPKLGGFFRGFEPRILIDSVAPRAEKLRDRLPERIRESLRPVPARALVVAGGMAALVIVILALAVVIAVGRLLFPQDDQVADGPARRGTSDPVTTSPMPGPPTTASPAELERAMKAGPPALDALADRYPADPSPRIEAARARVWARDFERAAADIRRALETSRDAKDDDRVGAVLYQTARARPSVDTSFALLTGPMGARGAEILWDLAGDDDVQSPIRQRAGTWLRSPAFRQAASESLLIAADLRTAKSCEAAYALLPSAKAKADHRSLSQLVAWRQTIGCGKNAKSDCMLCLRKDGLLEDTIRSIEARDPKRPPKTP